MTVIEFLVGVACIANTVLLSLIWIELRGIRWREALISSARRRWVAKEHTADE